MRAILGMKGVMTVDELRRGIEAIPEDEYHRLCYYRRWIRSITDNLLVEGRHHRGRAARSAGARRDGDFAPGASVRVRDDWPETRGPAHIRTPHYLRGMHGTVVRAARRVSQPRGSRLRAPGAPSAAVSRRVRSAARSGRKARPATNCWSRSTSIGWSRCMMTRSWRPTARSCWPRCAICSRRRACVIERRDRRAHRHHRCRQSRRRARAWWRKAWTDPGIAR